MRVKCKLLRTHCDYLQHRNLPIPIQYTYCYFNTSDPPVIFWKLEWHLFRLCKEHEMTFKGLSLYPFECEKHESI